VKHFSERGRGAIDSQVPRRFYRLHTLTKLDYYWAAVPTCCFISSSVQEAESFQEIHSMSPQKTKSQQESLALESTMKSVEKLLEKLESSETPLEQSLLAFEEGIRLIRLAQKTLSEAEQKVQMLIEVDGNPVEVKPAADEEGP